MSLSFRIIYFKWVILIHTSSKVSHLWNCPVHTTTFIHDIFINAVLNTPMISDAIADVLSMMAADKFFRDAAFVCHHHVNVFACALITSFSHESSWHSLSRRHQLQLCSRHQRQPADRGVLQRDREEAQPQQRQHLVSGYFTCFFSDMINSLGQFPMQPWFIKSLLE